MTEVRGLGLDAGSTTVKLVAVDAAGELVWHRIEDTDPHLKRQIARLLADEGCPAGVAEVGRLFELTAALAASAWNGGG